MKLKELAELLGCSLEGDGEVEIRRVASLDMAEEGDLAFLAHPRFLPQLSQCRASAILLPPDIQAEGKNVLRSPQPQLAFVQATEILHPPSRPLPGFHPTASIAPSAQIGKDVSIGAHSTIGEKVVIGARTVIYPGVVIYPEVIIGEDTVIHSHVSIRERTIIGNRVIIHNGAVIGSDGFGYLPMEDGGHRKIPQIGRVVIEDEVEVGANAAIDRAALGETRIGRGTKIDNLVQIAHNVQIGPNCILAGQVGIAGSSKIGKRVIMGGQVGISDHIEISDNVVIAAKSGVMRDVPANSTVAGIPHMNIWQWRKIWVLLPRLADIFKEIKDLALRLEQLEKKSGSK